MQQLKRVSMLIGTCIMIFLVNLDTSIVNLALPTISKALARPIIQTQWILSSYLLAAMIFFIVCGRLADHFGKKIVLLGGCFCFFISSVVLSITNALPLIIVMRVIQGIGFAATLNLAFLINAEAFPKTKQGLALGISVTLTGMGQALGPTLAGVLLTYFHWHSLFVFNIPFSLISFILLSVFYHESFKAHASGPWIDLSLFKINLYRSVLSVRFIFMACWSTMLFFMPIYLQNYLHYAPLAAGYIMLCMTLLLGGSSMLVGKLLDRLGDHRMLMIAMSAVLLSFVLLFIAIVWRLDSLIFIGLAVFGTYCGMMFPSTIYAGMHALPIKQKGVGMGIFFSGSFLFATLGITFASHLVLWVPSMPERFMILIVIMAAMTVLALWLQTKQKYIRSN